METAGFLPGVLFFGGAGLLAAGEAPSPGTRILRTVLTVGAGAAEGSSVGVGATGISAAVGASTVGAEGAGAVAEGTAAV